MALLVALTTQCSLSAGEEVQLDRRIEVKPEADTFLLGGAIKLRATYINRSDLAWKLETPEASEGVKVSYELVNKGDRPRLRFALAKRSSQVVKLPDGRTQIVQVVQPRSTMEIKAGATHELVIDLYSRWSEDIVPGEYVAWIEDAEQKLKSNQCTFVLSYSKESIPLLLASAAKEDELPAKRKWCTSWLQKIKPDFVLKLKTDKDSPETARKILEDNATTIRQFKEFWQSARDSKPIEALFSKSAVSKTAPGLPEQERSNR